MRLPHPSTARLRTALLVIDAASLGVAIWSAHLLRFLSLPETRQVKGEELLANPGFLIWILLVGCLLAGAAELYELQVFHRRRETMLRVAAMIAAWATAVVLTTFLRPGWAFGRGILILTALLWSAAMVGSRFVLTFWLRRRSRFSALVVGEPKVVQPFCRHLDNRQGAPWKPIDGSHLQVAEIPREVARQGANVVILAGSDGNALEMGPDLTALHFSGVPVIAASEIWAWLEERLPLEALTPVVFLHQPGFGGVHWTLFNRLTRIADIVLASLLLVLAAPILAFSGVLLLATDGPPILYRQVRIGQFGRPFTMLKLRTMARDAEPNGPEFASEADPRISRVGQVLRRFRLDELPQLINILKGEMSLVGPRPERPEFVSRLSEKIPYYAFRTAVPPGLTGWAQVNTSYARSLDDHRRKLEYDLYFIRERSVRLYLLTLLRTASAALVGVQQR